MQAHYGGVHLLLENARILDSGTWKWIHSSKSQALMHMTKKIGNGHDTCFLITGHQKAEYQTCWVQIRYLMLFIHGRLAVSQIKTIGAWEMIFYNQSGILFSSEQVPNLVSDVSDTWRWTGTKTGLFTFPSSWEIVRQPPFQFALLIWHPNYSPKMSICFLRALQGKLLSS